MMEESHFQVQLTAVLDVLMKSAVTDICVLAESWFKSLHLEITRNKKENDDLKQKLHTMQQQQEEQLQQLQQQKQLLHHQQQQLQHQQQKLKDHQQHPLHPKQHHNNQQPHNNNIQEQAAPEIDIKITKVESVDLDSELHSTDDATAGCTSFVRSSTEDFATTSQKWPSPEEQRKKTSFCHICAKEVECIKSHMESHNPNFKCHVCHKMFYDSVDFSRHLGLHTGTKHVCDVCSKTFGSKSGLLKHKSHHSRDWEKCKDCGQEFPTKRTLYSHREKAHTVPKKCLFCHLTFTCNSNLKKHLQTHRAVHS